MPVSLRPKSMQFTDFTRERLQRQEEIVRRRFTALIRADVIRPVGGDAADIIRYLRKCSGAIAQSLIQSAAAYSKSRWLWYLRRVPDELFERPGHLLPGGGYNRNVAEVLSGIGGRPPSSGHVGTGYPFDGAIADVVLRFVAGANYLSRVHLLTRNGSRGVHLSLTDDSELPTETWTHLQAEALRLYAQRRVPSGGRFLAKAGTELATRVSNPSQPNVVLGVGPILRRWLDLDDDLAEALEQRRIPQGYVPMLFDIRRVQQLAAASAGRIRWPSDDFAVAALAARFAVFLARKDPWTWASTLALGYVSIDYDHLIEWVESIWSATLAGMIQLLPTARFPATLQDLDNALQQPPAGVVPMRLGPMLRVDGNLALVDLAAITFAVETASDFVLEQGEVANVRGQHFESVVQEAIDESPWAPPEPFRGWVSRTLRHGGIAITDVDAIGTMKGHLLLVSAKSLVYTLEQDEGHFRAMRNATTTVVDACVDARRVVGILRANPRGDNYDVTMFARVDVVVCLPYVVHVPIGIATESICDGLLSAVSVGELKRFLNGSS